jgi:hypothetical protein
VKPPSCDDVARPILRMGAIDHAHIRGVLRRTETRPRQANRRKQSTFQRAREAWRQAYLVAQSLVP